MSGEVGERKIGGRTRREWEAYEAMGRWAEMSDEKCPLGALIAAAFALPQREPGRPDPMRTRPYRNLRCQHCGAPHNLFY